MEARAKARPNLVTVTPVVPCPDMEVEGTEKGMNSKTASELSAREQVVMEYVT